MEADVLKWLGIPASSTTSGSGGRTLRYFSVRSRTSVERRLWWKKEHSQTIEEEFVVEIASGLVVAHNYRTHITGQ